MAIPLKIARENNTKKGEGVNSAETRAIGVGDGLSNQARDPRYVSHNIPLPEFTLCNSTSEEEMRTVSPGKRRHRSALGIAHLLLQHLDAFITGFRLFGPSKSCSFSFLCSSPYQRDFNRIAAVSYTHLTLPTILLV